MKSHLKKNENHRLVMAQATLQHLEVAVGQLRPAGRPVARLLLGQLQPRRAPEAFGALEAAAIAKEGALGTTTPELNEMLVI